MIEAPNVDILCVDDNVNNLRSLEALLGDVNANIVQAHSGDDALRQLLTGDFALILLDIQMPNLDGYETAQLIRARERTRHVPIIFLTALNRAEVNVIKGYALGAVDFLFKPIVPEILRSKVNVFLELHRQRRQAQQQQLLLREAERRENDRKLEEAKQQYERSLLREEMDRERKVKEALGVRAEELARVVEEKERAERRLALLADSANGLLMGQETQGHIEAYRRVLTHLELDVHLEYRVFGDDVRLASHSGISAEEARQLAQLSRDDTIAGRVATERTRFIQDDLDSYEDPRSANARALGLRAVACFPLVAHGRLMGTVSFASRAARKFSGDEIALMQVVCDQVAVSLERDRLIDELRDRDRRKDEFLAMLAHELRNPMAPIRAAVDVIRNLLSAAGVPEPRITRALDSADRQVVHMIRLVDDLLDVSRITRGKVELRKAPVSLEQVVEQAVGGTEPAMRERRHTLSVQLPAEPVELFADGTRITQVLANLLHNAAKYTDPGGRIRLVAERQADTLQIAIQDSGIGIARELLPRVFEIFVQAEPTSDRASGGLGLGLTLVKTLVEMHDGSVEARSEGLGKGSEFVVRLPLPPRAAAQPAPATATQRAAKNLSRLPPLDILLVEDNPDIRTTMRDLLELHGHRVTEAEDGERGLALALQGNARVCLVDIGLPGLDGYTVAERIRAQTNGHGPTLIALTGFGTPEAQTRALKAGFDAHLVKPVSFSDLSQVLNKLVSTP